MAKIYTTKSNAQRAAKKFDVAQVVPVEGGFIVQTPDDTMDTDEVPTKDIAQDAPVEMDAEQVALDAEPSQVVEQPVEEILMQLRVYVRADDACALARKVANLVRNPVAVHNALTGTSLQIIQPGEQAPKVKSERAARVSDGQPTGKTAEIIRLAARDEGVTRAQLTATIGWGDKAPWTQVLKKAAERFGYELTIDKDAGRATYFFTKAA